MTGLDLASSDARLVVSAIDGGRIASFVVAGDELLETEGFGPIAWGSYPMVPFAGRIRDGRFRFDGRDQQLPLTMPPNAIHGTGYDRPWDIVDETTIAIDLGPTWPYAGRAVQRFELTDDQLTVSLTLEAEERMPGSIGWHPWFRRWLAGTAVAPTPRSSPVDLTFAADAMYERDPEGLPTGRLVPQPPGPWDDCFTGVHADPRLVWPGRVELVLSSSCDHWVVYDQRDHAVCVEPQTAPPDFVNQPDPHVVEPGEPLVATMTWRWRTLRAG